MRDIDSQPCHAAANPVRIFRKLKSANTNSHLARTDPEQEGDVYSLIDDL